MFDPHRQSDRLPPTFKSRLRSAALAAGGSVGVAGACGMFVMWLPGRLTPPPVDAVLAWSVMGPVGGLAFGAALLLSLGAGLAGLALGRVRHWVWPVWALVAALVLGPGLTPALSSGVTVTPERIDVRCGWPCASRTLPLADVRIVEVRCRAIRRRRASDFVTIDVSLIFAGDRIDLADARPRNPEGARDWFRKIERLETTALADVPHRTPGPNVVPCVRALATHLDTSSFAVARRMLGIGDAAWRTKYVPPHQAWRGTPTDGD